MSDKPFMALEHVVNIYDEQYLYMQIPEVTAALAELEAARKLLEAAEYALTRHGGVSMDPLVKAIATIRSGSANHD